MPYYLTPKQEQALEYFEQEIKQKGRALSLWQAAGDLEIRHTSVAKNLFGLRGNGEAVFSKEESY